MTSSGAPSWIYSWYIFFIWQQSGKGVNSIGQSKVSQFSYERVHMKKVALAVYNQSERWIMYWKQGGWLTMEDKL